MRTPEVYIAYTPRGAGLLAAIFYFVEGNDIYGWYTGARGGEFPAAFFQLENYYAATRTVLYATRGTDVYGGWAFDYTDGRELALDKPLPVDNALCHLLEAAQSEFAEEWLFYQDDPAAQGEIAAYHHDGLAVQAVNVKHRKLHKLNQDDVIWHYSSPGLDLNVMDYMRQRWPLDFK